MHCHFGANASHPHKDSCIPLFVAQIHDILGKISEVTSLLYSLCKLAIELTFEKFCIRMCMYSNKKVEIHRSTSFSKVTSLLHSLQMLLKAHRSQSTSFSKHILLKAHPSQICWEFSPTGSECISGWLLRRMCCDFWERCAPTYTHTHTHTRTLSGKILNKFESFRENPTGTEHDKLSSFWYDKLKFKWN